jgi:hypothetical protein
MAAPTNEEHAMNTLVRESQTLPLRRAFLLDAVATGAMGIALAIGADALEPLLGLSVALQREAGIICIAFAAYLAFSLTGGTITRNLAWLAIGVNAAWTLASFGLLATGSVQPTALGIAFVIAQAVVVLVFAELQYLGAKRAFRA